MFLNVKCKTIIFIIITIIIKVNKMCTVFVVIVWHKEFVEEEKKLHIHVMNKIDHGMKIQ